MAELPSPPEGIVLTYFIVSDDVERPGRPVPDAAETAPVREALLHPGSRRSSNRSGANHRPRGGLGARSLATEYARRRIRVSAEITKATAENRVRVQAP